MLPGFRLTLGFTLFYLSAIVLIPLAALVLRAAHIGWDGFLEVLSSQRVQSAFRVTFCIAFLAAAIDMVAPVLMAAWAMGRLLGPQLMVAGGGHQTSQWFGMYYAGQVGPRVPVPIIQALEDGAVLLTLLLIERHLRRITNSPVRPSYPAGTVTGVAMILWGIERSLDEHFLLGQDGALGSALVQIAGVVLVLGGSWMLLNTRQRWNRWREAGSPVDLASQESPTDA